MELWSRRKKEYHNLLDLVTFLQILDIYTYISWIFLHFFKCCCVMSSLFSKSFSWLYQDFNYFLIYHYWYRFDQCIFNIYQYRNVIRDGHKRWLRESACVTITSFLFHLYCLWYLWLTCRIYNGSTCYLEWYYHDIYAIADISNHDSSWYSYRKMFWGWISPWWSSISCLYWWESVL